MAQTKAQLISGTATQELALSKATLGAGTAGAPALTTSGDTNTGIFFPAADTIAFAEGGVESVRIDSSGRVGIGTTSPATTLDVNGGAQILGSVSGYSGAEVRLGATTSAIDSAITTQSTGTPFMFFDHRGTGNTGAFAWRVGTGAATERMRIDTSGRLLVGTSSTSSNTTALFQGYGGAPTGGAHLRLAAGTNAPVSGANLGLVLFSDSEHTNCAFISADRDGGTWSASSKPTRLVFSTTADGASSPTERFKITATGLIVGASIYTTTTANAANVNTDSNGALARSTSSSKYKTDIEEIDYSYSEKLLDCRPVWYRSLCERDNDSWSWWGFIAEEVAAIDPRLVQWKTIEVTYNEKGSAVETPCDPEPEGVAYDRFVPHLLNLIKRQKEQIEAMEARLSALEGQ